MEPEQNNLAGEEKKFEAILGLLEELKGKIEKQDERIEKLEIISSQKDDFSSLGSQYSKAPVPPPLPQNNFTQEWQRKNSQDAVSSQKNVPTVAADNLEENIGGKWFARIGITALVVGVSFLLKYAFDNNWVGETGRVIIGIMIGLFLLALGEKFIRKYLGYGQIITGGGIAVLYLSIFAAFNFYHLIDQVPAFLIMALITAVGIILSLRYDAVSLMGVAILGGFATPILISTGQNNEVGLLSYVLLLDVAILVVSVFKKWRGLNAIGLAGTVILFWSWVVAFYAAEALGTTMFFLTAFFIVYSISSLIYNLVEKEKSSQAEQLLTLFSATAYFGVSYALLNPEHHAFMSFFALLLAVYYFLWAYLVRGLTPEDENLYNFLAFLTVGFVTVAIPLQFENNVITISWLVEALILFYLGIKTRDRGVKTLGLAVFGLALLRLLTFDMDYPQDSLLIFNRVFLTFLFAALMAYIASRLFKQLAGADEDKEFLRTKQVVAMLVIAANFLTIVAISREINFAYDQKIQAITRKNEVTQRNAALYRNYQNDNYYQELNQAQNQNSVSLSIFWLVYGIILLAVGIRGNYKGVRVGGLILLMVAILKLFFYDLWNLGTLYRIISSISLGIVLLAISFAYQKYKDKIKAII